ncbi:unnamed protein product [Closterium sp. NIES-54]
MAVNASAPSPTFPPNLPPATYVSCILPCAMDHHQHRTVLNPPLCVRCQRLLVRLFHCHTPTCRCDHKSPPIAVSSPLLLLLVADGGVVSSSTILAAAAVAFHSHSSSSSWRDATVKSRSEPKPIAAKSIPARTGASMRNLERASCLTGVPALPTALSSALAMALWLVAFNAASSCHAQRINPSQAAFLKDSQTAWETRLPGWAVGVKCIVAKGISCDAKGMITELGLSYSGIVGSIPDSISALVALTDLYLSGNSLTGSIPDSISALTNLKDLSLHSNSLNGSIPDSISALTALTGL